MKNMLCILLFVVQHSYGQMTLQLKAGQSSPKATIKDVSWLQGHWQGEGLGGIAEEIWSPPVGQSMMFVFRLLHDNKVSFYEIGHIIEADNTLVMQLKHFDGALKGWEEKDETVNFKLIKCTDNKVYFEGLTMEKTDTDQLQIYVLVNQDGKKEEIVFNYQRITTR